MSKRRILCFWCRMKENCKEKHAHVQDFWSEWITASILCIDYFLLPPLLLGSDYILRGPELSGSLVWVRYRLSRHESPLYPLQLHQGGERLLGALREAQLHRLPVRPDQRRVPWQAALDGLQRHHPLLPYLFLCEIILYIRAKTANCLFLCFKNLNK